jgi:CBS-domain-containing membrane protein
MTVGELRRLLNTMPLTADRDQIKVLDKDNIDVSDVVTVTYDTGQRTAWINVELEDGE